MVGRAPSPQYPHSELAAHVQVRATWVALIAWKDKPTSNQTGKREETSFLTLSYPDDSSSWTKRTSSAQSVVQCSLMEGDAILKKVTYRSWDCTIPVKARAVPCSAGSDPWCISFSLHRSQQSSFTADKASCPFLEPASCPPWHHCGHAQCSFPFCCRSKLYCKWP